MHQADLPSVLSLVTKDLHIPLKQLHISDKENTSNICYGLLNNRWISQVREANKYSTPPISDLDETAIKSFLMPSILTNLPQGWNSFIITVLRKQQLLSHPTTQDCANSIFTHLIQLKNNLKLRDRQLLSGCYSSTTDKSYSQSTKLESKFLEGYFACNVIQVPSQTTNDLPQDTPSLQTSPSFPSHLLPTYFILETEDHFYFIHPHTKVTLLDAVKYSNPLLFSSRIKSLFLLYQLKHCIEDLSDSLTDSNSLNLTSFYIDPNLWLFSTGVTPPLPISLVEDEKIDEILNSRASMLQESTRLWQDNKLSNLNYLLLINEAAGRKKGDPNNHPFLPWVSDFKSPDVVSRDFTKSKYRLTKGDAQLDFTYTSPTYSSTIAETKLEPHHVTDTFSEITYFIYLARRTPRSVLCRYVRPRWEPSEYPTNVARIQEWTPDECIPEFFSDPSVFYSIHPDLPDLKVPDWCESPENFIAWHRGVLESDHVSSNLHNWIDLYFGYKLTGEAGLKAKNIPHFLIKKHSSPYNYGVNQLFKEPHPRKQISNYLHQYYTGRETKLSSEKEVNTNNELESGINRSSIISIEQDNINTVADNIIGVDSDPNEQGLYGSCHIDHFDVVQAPPADLTEPLIRKPGETKRGFSDFETTKLKHFPFTGRFRGKDVLDETQVLKYRSHISLPSNLDLGRLLNEFEEENLFYSDQSPAKQQCSETQFSKRNGHDLLYLASHSSEYTQIVLIIVFIEFTASDQLKSYPFTASLSERATLLRANLREDLLQDIPEVKLLLPLLDRYIKNSSLQNCVTIEFPLVFPSYFEPLHVFLSRLYSFKNKLFSLSHLEARKCFRASDYFPILNLLRSESVELLCRIPQEGLHLVGDYCKWVFTDSLLAPLGFIEVFSVIASYLPTSYLHNNYISCVQRVYCDMKDHTLYPCLFKSSFVTSLINMFGPNYYFSVLLKYLLKAITSSYCSSPVSISLLSDCLTQLHKQTEAAPYKHLERPSIHMEESDTEVVDLLNNSASSLIASETLLFLFSYFGIPISTRFLFSELIALLPDYSCKIFTHITSFDMFHNVFLHDTCYVTIHSILTLTNDKYATFLCFHYVTSWISHMQKRILNIRTEGFLSAILTLASIWLLSVTNDTIQQTLYQFLKEIVDVVYQVISSTSTFFTRGQEFRYHLHIALLQLMTQLISNGPKLFSHNVSPVKTAVKKIFHAFSAIQIIREADIVRENVSDNQHKINTQLLATFNADLLSQFSSSIYIFLQDNDIDIPSFAPPVTPTVKKIKQVFAYRRELTELVSLFYSSNISSRTDISSFSSHPIYTEERIRPDPKPTPSLFSSLPSTSQHSYHTKCNWIEYLKQTIENTNSEPIVFNHVQSLHGFETSISKLCHTPCENVIFGSSRDQVLVWRVCDSTLQSDVNANGVYKSHTKQIRSLSYLNSLDSVVSNDGCIHIWNIESMYTSYKHAHPSKVYQIHCNSPQTQRVIYSATNESTLTVLDTRVPRLAFDWVVPPSIPSTFHHINVTTDNHTIYLATSSGGIIMIDTRMGFILGQWSVSDTDISSMLLHQNHLFIASSDNTLKIFSPKGHQLYQTISCRNQTDSIEALTDSAVICSSYNDMAVTLFQRQDSWNPTNKWPIPKLNNSIVHSIAFLPLQQVLLASLEAGVVNVYGTNFSHHAVGMK
ncbi:hypothetical protein LOD99_1890 [Oopsacas minuta]|uniref:BEACH domain-containing protein n=1 Tax=Oopsacas minuta TaxID=111878 RepID=A0AAV7K4N5_9METZ|nr:hypothetical protein LOD99_1890 [Oopsacas minuta]